MIKYILCLCFILLVIIAFAQTDSTSQKENNDANKYEGQFEIGFIAGKFDDFNGNPQNPISAFTLQIFQGYRLNRYASFGLKTGLD